MTDYDPEARRYTPLALKLKERITRDGPLSVEAYMSACLQDPEHGYYVKQPAIGAGGDFVTAPEISQIFGELIGLWCAVVWQQMGSPARFNLIELGPGRGSLMADALRAARMVPGFLSGATILLIESNVNLRAQQASALAGLDVEPTWAPSLLAVDEIRAGAYATRSAAASAPTILIANEFLDTRPIRQLVRRDGLWFERTVTLDDRGRLSFGCRPRPARNIERNASSSPPPTNGSIMEIADGLGDLTVPLLELTRSFPVAALLIDYGHTSSLPGDSLQAVRAHTFEHPLTSPGEADLTTQVDFELRGRQCRDAGFATDGPVTQAELLSALGITQRASRLMSANPKLAGSIEAGVARLLSPTGMGARFKALGLRSPTLPPLPGFPVN